MVSSFRNEKPVVHYISCRMLTELTSGQRKLLFDRRMCQQCFVLGLKYNHEGPCSTEFNYKQGNHVRFKAGSHLLVFGKHPELNSDLLTPFQKEFLPKLGNNMKKFSLDIFL